MIKKYIGTILAFVSLLFTILGLIFYKICLDSTTTFVSEIIFYIFAIIAIVILLVILAFGNNNGLISSLVNVFLVAAFMIFLNSQLGNLGYYVYHINDIGDGLQASLIIGEIFILIAVIANSVSIIFKPIKLVRTNKK